jgi:EAL domain-containing protein (putative c-di-GMP-specific phosphodiesterase class I)
VEDADVLELLRGLGCDVVQGYHIARPLAADEAGCLIARTNVVTRKQITAAIG